MRANKKMHANTRVKIRLALDMIWEKPLHFLISIALIGIGFALMGFTLLIYMAGKNNEISAERVLAQGIDRTGIGITKWGDSEADLDEVLENEEKFHRDIFNSPVIHSAGAADFTEYEKEYFEELYDIQHGKEIHPSVNPDMLSVLMADQGYLPLCEWELADGVRPEKLDFSDKNKMYMYLGSAYRDVPVGTKFTRKDVGITYEVAGILKKDTAFPSWDLPQMDFSTLKSDMNMNYEIVCVNNKESHKSPWFFSVEQDYTIAEGEAELNRIAEADGVRIQEYSLRSVFDGVAQETEVTRDCLLEMLLLILIVMPIVVITLQIVQIFEQGHTFGILYSVGFLFPEIRSVMILRNILYFAVSLCAGAALLIGIGNIYFAENIQSRDVFFELLTGRALPVSLGVMAVLFCIITAIPCIVFDRQDPVKLIQGVIS